MTKKGNNHMMKAVLKRTASALTALVILLSLAVPFASAATQKQTNHNISKKPVTSNADNGSIPSAAKTVYAGDEVYANIQVDASQLLKRAVLYIKAPGADKYKKVATYTHDYFRYHAFSYTVGKKAGTLDYKFQVTYKNNETVSLTGKVTVKSEADKIKAKANKFIQDDRWKDGIWWGDQRPKISSYSSSQCCAYAADFVKYMYDKDTLNSGTKYTDASEIKVGDVIYGTPQHWMCIVSRDGNTLTIAQGNCSSKVRIAEYTLTGNNIVSSSGSVFKTFSYGYHYW